MKYKNFVYPYLILFFAFSACYTGSARCEERPANSLINESSPYLLKHAKNPVDWYPWGDEAFSLAKEKDKPILLSIGYLTCHWCNVMEEESFSDPQVAALLNDVFIPIKVDREERPDIDQIYMKACHLLSPACGWPLTLFLTPKGKPFYAGTYIPKENRFGRLGLLELIPRVKELWSQERDNILQSADSINAAIISSTIQLPGGEMNASQLDAAFSAFSQNYDSQHGGFGRRTKFPKPQNILFLLRYWHRTGKKEPLAMVEKTLTAMRLGGIYDQLGYGFHRYATDAEWRVPHFEKMLYDQALLVIAYLEAYQATSNEEYANPAKEILSYVLRDMTAKNGGFYSAESADSEGEEGKFYIWSAEEIRKILNKQDAALAAKIFHIMEGGNYIDSVTGKKTGQNILYIEHTADKLSEYDRISSKLLTARNSRPRPERDDKILTDWNGLMIAAFAKAAQVLDKPEYGEAAKRATQFILDNLRTQDGKLLHRWREGRAGLTASAADYSFITWGLLELYSWDFDPKWLKYALDLTSNLIENYWDDKLGGFYLTVYDKKSMLPRIKESIDTAMPSSNSVSMFNLLKLSRLTGNHTFEEKAAKISSLSSSRVKDSPLAFPMLLAAHDLAQAPSQEVVIVGKKDADDTKEMLKTLRKNYFPNAIVLFKPAGEANSQIMKFANYIEFMNAIDSKATAFVCTNFKCDFPTTDPATMLNSLRSISEKSRETN
jgi:uncharacterized protein YyaL (SSP411 family)